MIDFLNNFSDVTDSLKNIVWDVFWIFVPFLIAFTLWKWCMGMASLDNLKKEQLRIMDELRATLVYLATCAASKVKKHIPSEKQSNDNPAG